MKKWVKVIVIIVSILILCIVFDIVSIYARNKPIFAISDNNDSSNKIYYGLLYDTYNCQEYPIAQIKFKWSNFSCLFKTTNDETDDGRYNRPSYSIDNISIIIKDGTLTNKNLTLIIKDSTNEKYSFGQEFYIEKQTNNIWSKVKEIHTDYGFTQMAYYADTKELELKQDWEYIYGSLEKGIYRLIKKVFKEADTPITDENYKLISVNFEIQ